MDTDLDLAKDMDLDPAMVMHLGPVMVMDLVPATARSKDLACDLDPASYRDTNLVPTLPMEATSTA